MAKVGRPKKMPDITGWEQRPTVSVDELEVILGVSPGVNSKVRKWIRSGAIPTLGERHKRISTCVVRQILERGYVEIPKSKNEGKLATA